MRASNSSHASDIEEGATLSRVGDDCCVLHDSQLRSTTRKSAGYAQARARRRSRATLTSGTAGSASAERTRTPLPTSSTLLGSKAQISAYSTASAPHPPPSVSSINYTCRSSRRFLKPSVRATSSRSVLLIIALAIVIQIGPIASKSIQIDKIDSSVPQDTESSTRATTTLENLFRQTWSSFNKRLPFVNTESSFPSSTTTTSSPVTERTFPDTTTTDQSSQDESSTERDDDDAEGCPGLSVGDGAEAANITDNERLVALQSCIQGKVKRTILSTTRKGMEVFDKLQLTGSCTSSLLNLMSSLSEIKSFAFKFLDSSAKVPSGMMYGLLSDFGDFDECLSIRSRPDISLENEAEEGAYSGKYCLMSVKLNYHARLSGNQTVPPGIIEDGLLWDELVRNYWTSNSSKGFQIGMCVPSSCSNDDLRQIYSHFAQQYNLLGEIISCQDGLDLKVQTSADVFQLTIVYTFYTILALMIIGTTLDRFSLQLAIESSSIDEQAKDKKNCSCRDKLALAIRILICFSIARNWNIFIRNDNQNVTHTRDSARCSSRSSPTQSTLASAETSPSVEVQTDCDTEVSSALESQSVGNKFCELSVRVQPDDYYCSENINSLNQLSGLRLFVIIWITIGYSFLYPSANNYQYYRSIINMNITRDSVWFATTNFTLGIDMLLYMTGLGFVCKLAHLVPKTYHTGEVDDRRRSTNGAILQLILKKILRFWPTYLTVIGIAVVVPLLSDGPMWPEMVSKRIGESCRKNWWTNLLFINNFLSESEICLPSSWFVSILMQLFFTGSIIMILTQKFSPKVGLAALTFLLIVSCSISFAFAYILKIRAPMIRMDESFVMELDENIFRLYTNIFNNLGPFLIGMAGGFALLNSQMQRHNSSRNNAFPISSSRKDPTKLKRTAMEIVVALAVTAVAVLVLSSVFIEEYSRLLGSIYWSLHRVGWAVFTGYVIHNCAMGRWTFLDDFLSLSTFTPVSRLIPIAYLLYPIFIHMHSGLVRDGLHVSIYNMLNIYITRLVMTFTASLLIHLLVELPFCSIEEIFLNKWINNLGNGGVNANTKLHPLLTVAPNVNLQFPSQKMDNPSEVKTAPQTKPDGSEILERSISEDSGNGE